MATMRWVVVIAAVVFLSMVACSDAATPKPPPPPATPKTPPAPATPKTPPAPATPKTPPAPATPKTPPAPATPKPPPAPVTPKPVVASKPRNWYNLSKDYQTWTPKGVNITDKDRTCSLSLKDPNEPYASLFSKQAYLYGGVGAWMKLVPNDSAGTVTTLYLSSSGPKHCEFDFEFLGNSSGEPYILHTNIFVDGVGGREQQIRLWFDPTKDFHNYNFQWNNEVVVFFVDNTPIRMYGNYEWMNNATSNATANSTLPPGMETFKYPKSCPMNLYLSIWDGSGWATQSGAVKLNWTHAPFVAQYRNFQHNACLANPNDPKSITACQNSAFAKPGVKMNGSRRTQMRWVKNNFIKYNYCTDKGRYPTLPPECKYNIL